MAAAVVVAVGASGIGRAAAQPATFTAPAFAADFPDPAVLTVGGTYVAYATGSAGRNLQVTTSPDLRTWTTPPTDPLPVLPAWASPGLTWAPSVTQVGGTFVMWYTVHDPAAGRQCLSVATSSTATGPFHDTSAGPAVCQLADGGSIDPNVFRAASGQLYLIWKSDDNALGRPTHLWGEPLTAAGTALTGSPALLLSMDAAWQSPSMEGPTVVAAPGGYDLFYGASNYASASSGIGWASSPTPLGAYTDRSRYGPWLGTTGAATGPQGPSVFTDTGGATHLAFAAWYGTVGYPAGERALWIGSLSFSWRGVPVIR